MFKGPCETCVLQYFLWTCIIRARAVFSPGSVLTSELTTLIFCALHYYAGSAPMAAASPRTGCVTPTAIVHRASTRLTVSHPRNLVAAQPVESMNSSALMESVFQKAGNATKTVTVHHVPMRARARLAVLVPVGVYLDFTKSSLSTVRHR